MNSLYGEIICVCVCVCVREREREREREGEGGREGGREGEEDLKKPPLLLLLLQFSGYPLVLCFLQSLPLRLVHHPLTILPILPLLTLLTVGHWELEVTTHTRVGRRARGNRSPGEREGGREGGREGELQFSQLFNFNFVKHSRENTGNTPTMREH